MIKENSDWLIQNIEKYPKAASTIGLGISIYLLHESLSDDSTASIKQDYKDLLSTPIEDFATREVYLKHMFKQTNKIRRHVIERKAWQKEKTISRTILSALFGSIGWVTTNPILKWSSYTASAVTGVGALIHAKNWGDLYDLVQKLEKSGHIV